MQSHNILNNDQDHASLNNNNNNNNNMLNSNSLDLVKLQLVTDIIKNINRSNDLDEVLLFISTYLKKLVPYQLCSLALLDNDHNSFTIYPIKNLGSENTISKYYEVPYDKTILTTLLNAKHEICIQLEDEKDLKKFDHTLIYEGISSLLSVPLEIDSKIIGALLLGSEQKNCYTPAHISIVKSMNEIISLSLDKFFFIKKLKQSKEEYKALFEYTSDAVIITDSSNNLLLTNKNFEILTSYSKEKLSEYNNIMNFFDTSSQKDIRTYCEAILRCPDIIPNKCTANLITVADEQKAVELSFGCVPNAGKIIISIRDITKRVKAEKTLQKKNKHLTILHELSTDLQNTLSLQERLKIAGTTFQRLGFDRIRIYLRDQEENVLCGVYSSHMDIETFKNVKIPLIPSFKKAYHCFKSKTPIVVNKESITYLNEYLGKTMIKQSASLPLVCKGNMMGMISLDNKYSQNVINDGQIKSLMTFANHLAVAIENAQLYDTNIEKIKRLSAMYAITKSAAETLDVNKILNQIIEEIVAQINVDYCSILLYDELTNSLTPTSVYNLDQEYLTNAKSFSIHGEGISTKSFYHKEIIYIPNVLNEKEYVLKDHAKRLSIVSMLSVPLVIADKSIGVINLYTKSLKKYKDNELQFIKMLVRQAAITIRNSQFYSKIKTDKENFSALLEIGPLINSTLEVENVLSIILDKTIELTKADSATLLLLEDDMFKVKLCKGFSEEYKENFTLNSKEGISGLVLKSGKPIILPDVTQESSYIQVKSSTKSEATIPLKRNGRVIGVLDLESQQYDNFSKYKTALQILTNQISVALEKSILYDEINQFNQKLKNEIYEATRELRIKNEELRKIDKLKSDFVSNVSHELRTPLTSIKGYTVLMKEGKLGEISSQQKDSLNIVCEEADRLTRLINNVLDLSKLENTKLNIKKQEVSMHDIVVEVIDTLQMLAKEKNIELSLVIPEDLPIISASKDLIKQVFVNLLGNALKFTPPYGKITVRIIQREAFIESTVTDTGPGIPQEFHDKLFDKFYQVDSSMTRQHGGTGLGLPISKHIIEQHNGAIRVESEVGKGSSFIFTIPINDPGTIHEELIYAANPQ